MKFNNLNVSIGSNVHIGKNVRIGDNTTIYNNVRIGDDTIISNNCIIGEPAAQYYSNPETHDSGLTIIGENSLIRSHCIIYEGSTFGKGLITGHRATVREKSTFGENCLISTLVDVQGNCKIGNYSRLYSNVHICEFSEIGNYVFIYPYSIFTNDPQPPSNIIKGAKVCDYSIITVHCCVLPGVTVGQHSIIGANSVISTDIEEYAFAIGSPAKRKCDIREIKSKENNSETYYPWPYHFDRGMPWKKENYHNWILNEYKEA